VAWAEEREGRPLRWWQVLVAVRVLEVDATGSLCWASVILTTARQVGKSTLLRLLLMWRIEQRERFGEEQTVLLTGKDLPVIREIQRPARLWAMDARREALGWTTRNANGQEEIVAPDGSRFLLRSRNGVYGYSVNVAAVDEGWGVAPGVVDDGIEPTSVERAEAQVWITSTAHRRATPLVPERRAAALREMIEPGDTLLIEWSAPRSAAIGDRQAWRAASPHWTPRREALVARACQRAVLGQSQPGDDDDPVESFRSQWLNVWPVVAAAVREELLVAPSLLVRGVGPDGDHSPVLVMEDNAGGTGQCVVLAQQDATGTIRVTGTTVPTRAAGWRYLQATLADGAVWDARVLVGATLSNDPEADDTYAEPRGATELKKALALFRALASQGRVVFNDDPDVDALVQAMVGARTVATATGVGLAWHRGGVGRLDLVRATLWAVQEAALVQAVAA
jgi:hypothetical protein